jgi:N-acyl-L-homoserine lactone synthetase
MKTPADEAWSDLSEPPLANKSLNERVLSLAGQAEVFAVTSAEDREAVYRLRYTCYLQEQAIEPSPLGMLSDVYDDHPRTITFGIRLAGRIVASIRLHLLDGASPASPTFHAFQDLVEPMLHPDEPIIDCSRFVVDRDASRSFPELVYVTLRVPITMAEAHGASTILAAVRVEHMPFYKRLLQFETISEPRAYHQLTKPLGLMVGDLLARKDSVTKRHPFLIPTHQEIENIKMNPMI